MRPRIWDLAGGDRTKAARLAAALRLPPLVARLLCQRGLDDPEAASRFLNPSLDQLHDPFALADMPAAIDRLLGALARQERIAIHGDYDVDGVTSTVMLRRALELLGGDVVHFIPDRIRDGYGLQPEAIDRLHAGGVQVIVSVDCGIRSADAARRARELGVDLIITDHHEPEACLPPALAVINPKRADCTYPDSRLAGAGVTLKLVQALCARTNHDRWLPGFLKMAAIGTLADVVPLIGENRVIARLGLDQLSSGPHAPGLQALLNASGLAGRRLDSFHVTFMLAPRVNAAGRMSTPDIATRLLLVSDERFADDARDLAEQLNAENRRRQEEEATLLTEARRVVETDPDVGAHAILVVGGEGWHRGVIGIVASKLVETFYRPVVVLSVDGGVAHGSCRSIPGFDMLAALEHAGDLLLRFGGHRQAAGLTLEAARIREFRVRLQAYANDRLDPSQLMPRLRIDGELGLKSITTEVVEGIAALAPFGAGNPRPVFRADRVEVCEGPHRIKERHLKMSLRQHGRVFRTIAWRSAERASFFEEHRRALDVAFSLEQTSYRGDTWLELSLADAKASQ